VYAKLDSGADISVLNSNCLPREVIEQARNSGEVGEKVIVLRPSSTNALKSQWIRPCTIEEAVVGNAFMVRVHNNARKAVHVSQMQEILSRIDQVGVIFDNENSFGTVVTCPSTDDVTPPSIDRFEQLDLDHLSDVERTELIAVLREFNDVFNDQPGHCKIAQHSIKLIEGAQPKAQRAYRIHEKLKSEVSRQIKDLLEQGKLRPSNSPFSHPVVCVTKPNVNIRVCVEL